MKPRILSEPGPTGHEFGGRWTEEKLDRLKKYLSAYTKIFKANPRAAMLKTIYVDAFAGAGYRVEAGHRDGPLLPFLEDQDALAYRKGSALIALETEPPFSQYVFIEHDTGRAAELDRQRRVFEARGRSITIIQEEANASLRLWCKETAWRRHRAVVFLDPYGMEVEWATMEALASTRAIDVWILFPLGQAVIRLLTRRRPPPAAWARRLTRLFGTEAWREAFYGPTGQGGLFGQEEGPARTAGVEAVGKYFLDRLRSVFAGVAPNPLPLLNSKGVPIYLLCFAAGNPRGAPTAIKIARYILERR